MTAPIRITRLCPGPWRIICRLCASTVHAGSHPRALALALAHLTALHPRPWPSGMADPEPGCTCDPYGAAQCHDHRSNR